MLDKMLEMLGESTDAANMVSKLSNKIDPLMTDIKNNAENVNPEFMKMYEDNLKKVGGLKQDLAREKEALVKAQQEQLRKRKK